MVQKNERGEMVIEASIIVTLVMLFITVLLYIGMVLYQQTVVSVMANQTASGIAQVYSNNLKDPFTGYINPERVYQSVTYTDMKNDAYIDVLTQKAYVYGKYRMISSRFLNNGRNNVQVDVVQKPNELLKSQIVVTIEDRYNLPLIGLFGVSNQITFKQSGRADCTDVLEYLNGVDAIGNPSFSNVEYLPHADNRIVTFIPDKGNPTHNTSMAVREGKSVMSSYAYTHSVMPSEPTHAQWRFIGWVDENGTPFTATTVVQENMIVYGAWNCTVTLHAPDGTIVGVGGNTHSFDTQVYAKCILPQAERDEYTFVGWFTEENGGGVPYLSNDTVVTGNVVLYAHWTCAHPTPVETGRTGTVCQGGTISYVCGKCGATLEDGTYAGTGCVYTARCDVKHERSVPVLAGNVEGGCGFAHYSNKEDCGCGYAHGDALYAYCRLCIYCHHRHPSNGGDGWWCANEHKLAETEALPAYTPLDNGTLQQGHLWIPPS